MKSLPQHIHAKDLQLDTTKREVVLDRIKRRALRVLPFYERRGLQPDLHDFMARFERSETLWTLAVREDVTPQLLALLIQLLSEGYESILRYGGTQPSSNPTVERLRTELNSLLEAEQQLRDTPLPLPEDALLGDALRGRITRVEQGIRIASTRLELAPRASHAPDHPTTEISRDVIHVLRAVQGLSDADRDKTAASIASEFVGTSTDVAALKQRERQRRYERKRRIERATEGVSKSVR